MPTKESYTVKQVKKLYDISVESTTNMDFNNRILVKVYIDFTPEEVTEMTNTECTSYGKWYYYPETNQLSFEDFIYIRRDVMPILAYTEEEYHLDNFCEDLGYEELNRALNSLGYDVNFLSPGQSR
jgi:hypothetical protein